MSSAAPGGGEERLGRILQDITQLLESADGAEQRVRRVLGLLRHLVPYQQCAMLEARPGQEPRMLVVPEAPPADRAALTTTLQNILGRLVDTQARASLPVRSSETAHLAVPLVGLDEVIGVLFVRSAVGEYTEDHLRGLSAVAAKLAAYATMLRARVELVDLARQRDEARRSAEAANRAKDEFLALISHELRTPLSSMLAWAHLARSTSADAGGQARAIEELERNVQTQAKLIDCILEMACIASADMRLSMRTIEPAGLIEAAIDRLRVQAERKSVQLHSYLDGTAMPLVLDPDRIGQVVSILVANAIDFTPAGGRVEVCLERTAGFARIQVKDSGSGISREALPHVFDRVRPAALAGTRAGEGAGDGLAIVKDLVDLHGGRVAAESADPAPGVTFTVELPHQRGASAAREPALLDQTGEQGLLAGIRVLLVDHDLGIRESFQFVLEDFGAQVTAVASAPEALAVIERSPPDVLLFGDLAMRGESIPDIMREVTARAFPLPVASISAWRMEDSQRDIAAGFHLHLAKPLSIGALVGAVADLAGRGQGQVPRSAGPGHPAKAGR